MKFLGGNHCVEVKVHRYKIHQTEKIFLYENEIHQNLLELNIKYKWTLRLGEIKKLFGILILN